MRVRTTARDRDDYLAHPPAGERSSMTMRVRVVANLRERRPGGIQIVVSDGLNANAINAQLRSVLPPLRRRLAAVGHVAETDIVVDNGCARRL